MGVLFLFNDLSPTGRSQILYTPVQSFGCKTLSQFKLASPKFQEITMPNRSTPTDVRRLSGSHPERLNRREARFEKLSSLPVVKGLDEAAQEIFNEVGPELLANGLLNRGSVWLFAQFCRAISEWQHAAQDVDERGRKITQDVFNRTGEVTGTKEAPNPALAEMRNSAMLAKLIAQEFGLTPSSSSKVQAEPGAGQKKASFADFLSKEKSEDGSTRPN